MNVAASLKPKNQGQGAAPNKKTKELEPTAKIMRLLYQILEDFITKLPLLFWSFLIFAVLHQELVEKSYFYKHYPLSKTILTNITKSSAYARIALKQAFHRNYGHDAKPPITTPSLMKAISLQLTIPFKTSIQV